MEIIGYLIWSAIVSFFAFMFFMIILTGGTGTGESKDDVLWAKGLGLFCGVMQFWLLIDK